jgi:hypothetical protein
MTGIHLALECRTNVPRQSIKKDFLSKFTEFLQNQFNTEAKVTSDKYIWNYLFLRQWNDCLSPPLYDNQELLVQWFYGV